jgi:hypothetical protein
MESPKIHLVEVNADHWKSWLHDRIATPMGESGAFTLFDAKHTDHLSLAKHLTAERETEQFVAGKGLQRKWERVRANNHWFDSLYYACAAAHFCGIRLVKPEADQQRTRQRVSGDTRHNRQGGWIQGARRK